MTAVKLRQTLVVLRAPLVDDTKGNKIRDWPNAVASAPVACSIQPVASTEQTIDQDRVVSRSQLFSDVADILATDRIVCAGITYQVDGEVLPWPAYDGSVDHLEGLLKRVTGA